MNRLITSVLFGLVTINTMVLADPSRPRLVVGIVVDQLRTDYMEYLRSLFGEKGFKRLMEQG
ncbi:MAG: alkaline phosphatase family protein, partial [Muribaculaceae bacterium]|nr:alkaline phosphatase family protein [Muribaculaceae bacterium]